MSKENEGILIRLWSTNLNVSVKIFDMTVNFSENWKFELNWSFGCKKCFDMEISSRKFGNQISNPNTAAAFEFDALLHCMYWILFLIWEFLFQKVESFPSSAICEVFQKYKRDCTPLTVFISDHVEFGNLPS